MLSAWRNKIVRTIRRRASTGPAPNLPASVGCATFAFQVSVALFLPFSLAGGVWLRVACEYELACDYGRNAITSGARLRAACGYEWHAIRTGAPLRGACGREWRVITRGMRSRGACGYGRRAITSIHTITKQRGADERGAKRRGANRRAPYRIAR